VSIQVGEIDLIQRPGDKVIKAKIFRGLEERHFRDHEDFWLPPMLEAAKDARSRCTAADGVVDTNLFGQEMAQLRLQDVGWDWRRLNAGYGDDSDCALFAVEAAGRTQGLMLLEGANHATRHDPKGNNLVYIERIASAPWNRGTFMGSPQFGQTGYALVRIAIEHSRDLQLDGRVALHSVSGSVSFYNKCGMTHFGPDRHKNGYDYFEMSHGQADAFSPSKLLRRGKR